MDITIGQKINNWTVLEIGIPLGKRNRTAWKCKCKCGKIKNVAEYSLKHSRPSKSCGCLRHRQNTANPKWKGHGDISASTWCHINTGARLREIPFEISIEEAWNIYLKQNRKCALTGLDIPFPKNSTATRIPSLDRIDSEKGYIRGNVQWVHKDINYMKQDYTQTEFINYCKLVANYETRL